MSRRLVVAIDMAEAGDNIHRGSFESRLVGETRRGAAADQVSCSRGCRQNLNSRCLYVQHYYYHRSLILLLT